MNEAVTTQAISALPPDADPQALTPIEQDTPKQPDERRLLDNPVFHEYLNKIADYATAQANSPAQWERRRKTTTLRNYILGYFYGLYDNKKGFVSAKEEGDGIYFDPQTPTAIDDLVASFVKSKPQLKCEPRSGDDRIDKREAARVAEMLLQMDNDQDFTPKKEQREWKWNLLAGGETYRITYFNTNKKGRGFAKEVFEEKEVGEGETAHHCALCDGSTADESGGCVECGNPQMDTYEAPARTVQVKKGVEYQQVGDVDWDAPDSLEMTVIGDTDEIDEALIVRRERMIPRCVLEDALGKENLPSTKTPDTLSYKQRYETDPDTGGMKEFELLLYEELWVAPAVYANYQFPKDTATQGGNMVPQATRGRDVLPDGLFFSRVQKVICETAPQGISECISHCVNSIGENFHGQGEWDLIELQDQATEAKSMKMNSMLLDSTQPLIVREGIMDADEIENKFGLILTASAEYKNVQIDDMMGRVPAGKIPTEAYQLGEELKGEINQRTGRFSTSSDNPDIKAMGTATGIDAITENAAGRRGPALMLYAQMQVDQAYQKLELRRKFWCKAMYHQIAKELGGDAVEWFMKSNVYQDFAISVVPGSWMPRTETKKKEGFEAFLAVAGPIIAAKGDPKLLDEILRQANDIHGAGINFDDFKTQSIEAQIRLDKLRSVASFAEQQFGDMLIDPETQDISTEALELTYQLTAEMLKITTEPVDDTDIFASLPIDVMFDKHSEFEEVYTDWLTSTEGRAASPYERRLVRQLADYHVQAESYRMYRLKQYENLTQLADLEANIFADKTMADASAATAPPPAPEAPVAPPEPPKMAEADRLASEQAHQKEMKQMDIDAKNAQPPASTEPIEARTTAG